MLSALNYNDRRTHNNYLSIIVIFLCTYFVYTDFNIPLGIGVGLIALLTLRIDNVYIFTPVKIPFIICTGTIIFNSVRLMSAHDKSAIAYSIILFILSLYLLLIVTDSREIYKIQKYIKTTALLMAFVVLIAFLIPKIYMSFIYVFLSHTSKLYVMYCLKGGYGVAVGASQSYPNTILACGVILSFTWILTRKEQQRSYFSYLVVCLICLCGMLAEGRRSEMLCVLITLFCAYVAWSEKMGLSQVLKMFVFGILFAIIIGFTLNMFIEAGYLQRYVRTFNVLKSVLGYGGTFDMVFGGANDITSGRAQLWQIAWDEFVGHPFFGIGFRRFAEYIPSSYYKRATGGMIHNVHNDYLQILCETGCVGFLFIVIIPMFANFKMAYKLIKRSKQTMLNDGLNAQVSLFSFAVMLYCSLVSCLDPVFYTTFYWFVFSMVIALMNFVYFDEKKHEHKTMA